MHADIHERAEVDDVAHGAGQFHTGFQVLHAHNVAAQQRFGQAVAHVAPGAAELGNDVLKRRAADAERLAQPP